MAKLYQIVRPICISATGIDERNVQVLEAAEPVYGKNINCYAGCIMQKMGIVSWFSHCLVRKAFEINNFT